MKRIGLILGALFAAACGSPDGQREIDTVGVIWHPPAIQSLSVNLTPGAPTTSTPIEAHFTVTNLASADSDGRVDGDVDGNTLANGQNGGVMLVPAHGSISGYLKTFYGLSAGSHQVHLTYKVHNGDIIVATSGGFVRVPRYDVVDTFNQTIQVVVPPPRFATTFTDFGYNALYHGNELAGGLSNWCAADVDVTYKGDPSRRSELHLFARDPATIAGNLASLGDDAIRGGAWTAATQAPDQLGRVVAIPYPPHPQAPTTPIQLSLAETDFWTASGPGLANDETSCHPVATPSTVLHSGAIRAAAVYDHGLCSTQVVLDDLLSQVTQGVWNGFKGGGADNPVEVYTKAFASLERTDSTNVSAFQSAFLLAFHYLGDHAGAGNEVWGLYKYAFGLKDGLFQIVSSNKLRLDDKGTYGWAFGDKMAAALDSQVADGVHSVALGRQMVDVLGLAARPCTLASECANSADILASQVTVASAAAVGLPNASESDLQQLRCTLGSAKACAAVGRSVDSSRWQCPLLPDPAQAQVCRYFLPIKRLNPMSDAIELVFFDAPSVTDPAFALAAAGGASKMCDFVPASVGTPPGRYYRGYTSVGTGP